MSSSLQTAKVVLIDHSGLAKDALHIYIGLGAFFLAAALFRWPISGPRPWIVAAMVALAGEAWDLRDTIRLHMPIILADNWHDIWNTLAWPTAIMLLARFTQVLRRR